MIISAVFNLELFCIGCVIVETTYLRIIILAYFLTDTLNWQVLWGKEIYFYSYFYIYIFIK